MDLTTTTTTTTSTPTTTPDTDNDTPPHTHTQQIKHFSSFPNGTTVKKHYHFTPYHHHHHHHQFLDGVVAAGGGGGMNGNNNIVISYRECLKNHAASIGGHALDGCGEFMASSTVDLTDPTSLKCAACGCHRNFHRREPDDYYSSSAVAPPLMIPHFLDFRHPPSAAVPRTAAVRTTSCSPSPSPSSSPSPPPPPPPPRPHPLTTQPFAPAGQMLLALSSAAHEDHQIVVVGGGTNHHNHHHQQVATPVTPTAAKSENHLSGRKRFRTKFSQEQKEKMHSFSEKLGWKLQKCDDAMVRDFCNEIGVARGVLKVWMHNNKNTLGKKDISTPTTAPAAVAAATTTTTTVNNKNNNEGHENNMIIITSTNAGGSHNYHNGSSSSS